MNKNQVWYVKFTIFNFYIMLLMWVILTILWFIPIIQIRASLFRLVAFPLASFGIISIILCITKKDKQRKVKNDEN